MQAGARARLAIGLLLIAAPALPQQLLDHVVSRVDGYAITLTDVQAALGLGVIRLAAGADRLEAGTQQLVDRQLILAEVQRFPPPEPPEAAVDREVARLQAIAGSNLASLKQSTGLTDQRIRDVARADLRILAYLEQRFGPTTQVSDEDVAQYYREHEAEFTRNGQVAAFEDVEPVARERASAVRRNAIIDQWLRDLRTRADVVINPAVPAR